LALFVAVAELLAKKFTVFPPFQIFPQTWILWVWEILYIEQ
jgi:hypothetical protein